jgi:hypothetical protein
VSRLVLIASSNDFLVEERLREAVDEACGELECAEAERQPGDVTPAHVALELRSPSLFAPTRVLVVEDVRSWLDTTAPPGALEASKAQDLEPLLEVIEEGLPDGTALLMGAWCGRKPKGRLVSAVQAGGAMEWIPLPDPPKPWEDVQLSADQRRVLRGLLAGVAGEARFEPAAADLLLVRLGFDPRRLVQETRKLVTAAGDGPVTEALVRRLTLPRERSLEVVRDAVLQRDPGPLLELVGAAAAGLAVNDWQGRPLTPDRVGAVLCGQLHNLLHQLLFVRRLAEAAGVADQMTAEATSGRGWYRSTFTSTVAPALVEELGDARRTPLGRRGKAPSQWALGQLFRGAALYRESELVAALADGGGLEVAQRGSLGLEALSAWIATTFQPRSP